jgi:hypothetical protein
MNRCVAILFASIGAATALSAEISVQEKSDHIQIETDALNVRINTKGYVSGTASGGLLDKKTGARDLGFGLHIMDFLLGPGKRDDGYMNSHFHGRIEKHYVEGPQICTQAKELKPEIIRGSDFVAVRFRFTFTKPGEGYRAGSTWEQTMVFQNGLRYYFSSERITSANDHPSLFYRIDMPGHLKHTKGDRFEKIWLSYLGELKPADFDRDFAPDDKFLYQRDDRKPLKRMIRAYQVTRDGSPGPWLAGMTLDASAVSEAWCHQRGYICFIQELHMRGVKRGESFGAAYIVGWFDDRDEMERIYDKHAGAASIAVSPERFELRRASPGAKR